MYFCAGKLVSLHELLELTVLRRYFVIDYFLVFFERARAVGIAHYRDPIDKTDG